MDVGDGYKHYGDRWKRELFNITHRYNTLQYAPTAITPKGYGVYVPETKLSFRVLSDHRITESHNHTITE